MLSLVALLITGGIYFIIDRFVINREVSLQQLDTATKTLTFAHAPPFTLNRINGVEVQLSQLSNKIIIVHFWASWCAPCAEELPSLLKFMDKFKNDVILLAISEDTAQADLLNFLSQNKISESESVLLLEDRDGLVAKKYGTSKLPESYILNRDLKVLRKIGGSRNWLSHSSTREMSNFLSAAN